MVGIDQEVGVGIFVKASPEKREADGQFRQDLELYSTARSLFSINIRQTYKLPEYHTKIKPAFAIFACNINISEADRKFAKEKSIAILDENDLEYYEELVEHVGTGAKYQFLADVLDDSDIPALNIVVPAIRMKTKKITYYSFAIQPEYLLKISYIAHRARGQKADLGAYQRMAEKSKLAEMREYIDKPGIFPTNIVISLKKKQNFEEKNVGYEGPCGEVGLLKLKAAYKSAWIIDGQHRLYAYSGQTKANNSLLSVIAFEELPLDIQADFFIDINSKQKRVKQSLLQQLFDDVHKNAVDPNDRIKSLIAQAILLLDNKQNTAFYGRIQKAEEKKSSKRCITWNAMFNAISDGILTSPEHGILWVKDNDEATKERIAYVVNEWFTMIKQDAQGWWNAGSAPGSGGLAMNDSITACFHVLKSVLQYLKAERYNITTFSNQELCRAFQPYATIVSKHLASLTKDERQAFRELRGGQGQTQRTRMLEVAINKEMPKFLPPTLKEYIQERDGQTRALLIEMNNILRGFIIEKLQNYYGTEDWWLDGIPVNTQQRVQEGVRKDKEKRGVREQYLDFGDYISIFQQNWDTFKDFLEYRNMAEYAESSVVWLQKVIDMQELINQNKQITPEQLDELDRRYEWLRKRITQN